MTIESPEIRHLVEGLVALGLGVLIGLEREHRHTDEPGGIEKTILGVRTFALLSLFGWVSCLLPLFFPLLPLAVLAIVTLFVLAQYLRSTVGHHGLGITTEIAAVLTSVLGILVHQEIKLAVAIAIGVSVILISKPWIRGFVPQLMRRELTATLQFLLIVFIVLPLLPAKPVDPWNLLPPQKIGIFVVVVAGIGFIGYVLTRLVGPGRAAGWTGVLGGLASSTAVTASMAEQVKQKPNFCRNAQLAVFLANTVMCGRVIVITIMAGSSVAGFLAPPVGAMGVIMLVAAYWAWRKTRATASPRPTKKEGHDDAEPALKNPFALVPALKFGALLCGVIILAKLAQDRLGDAGFLLTAVAAGLTDVDAITIAASRQATDGTLAVSAAAMAVILAMCSNTVVKTAIAWVGGGRDFARDIALWCTAAVVVGLGVTMGIKLL